MPLINLISSTISSVLCSPPVHLLCFSTLFGAQLFQTIVITKVSFTALPRPAFIRLQDKLWPIYFRCQSLLLFLTAITFPSHGVLSLAESKWDWIPFLVSGGCAMLNLLRFGPQSRRVMHERAEQGQESSGKTADEQRKEGIIAVKKRFSRAHAMSIHLNLICIIATFWHGWRLAEHIKFA